MPTPLQPMRLGPWIGTRIVSRTLSLSVGLSLLVGVASPRWVAAKVKSAANEKPTTESAAKPDPKLIAAANAAVHSAALALVKEYEAHEKAVENPIATACDYFTSHPDPAVTPQAILAALNSNYGNSVPCSYYVKWQLLSGLIGVALTDEKDVGALVTTYRHACAAPLRRAMGSDRARLEHMVAMANASGHQDTAAGEQLDAMLKKSIAETTAANTPLMEFRNELFLLLPVNFISLSLGLEDMYSRVGANQADAKLWPELDAALTEWEVGDAKPAQLMQISSALQKIIELNKDTKVQGYRSAVYNGTVKKIVMVAAGVAYITPMIKQSDRCMQLAHQSTEGGAGFSK